MSPSKVGRPPRVTPGQIAEAALAIGLDRATVRNVAERLGMSVPGLYHHVRTREDLLAMAAAHGLGELQLPAYAGQPLATWLTEYARFVFDALVAQPELLGQMIAGTVNSVRLAQHVERFLEILTAQGFGVADAYRAYSQLMSAVGGAAITEVGRRASATVGHSTIVDLERAARALGADTVPLLRELVSAHPEPDPFDAVLLVVAAITPIGGS